MYALPVGDKKAIYYGETHRAWYDRARDHAQALISRNQSYAIVKHWMTNHGDMSDPPSFNYKLVSSHKSAIARQITEAILIDIEPNENLMNGRGEFGQNHVPRMVLPEQVIHVPPKLPTHLDQQQSAKRKEPVQFTNFHNSAFDEQFSMRKKRARFAKTESTE